MASQCQNCGGALVYSPSLQRLECRICGSTFRPERVEAYARDVKQYDCRVYTCSHCGGEIVINGTEASTVCIYCGNPAVVFTRVSKERKPDGILPFSVTKNEAGRLIEEHLKKGAFIPSGIRRLKAENITGIYIPYYVVNCDFHDAVLIESKVSHGKRRVSVYNGYAGSCEFENVGIDASSRLNDNVSKRLEPYFFDDVKDFDEDYLNGFYSDTSDINMNELQETVLNRCDEMFYEEVKSQCEGREKRLVASRPAMKLHEDIIYLMVPAWFCTFVYEGQTYTILVNGQTGKVVGALPYDRVKVSALGLTLVLLFMALLLVPFYMMEPSYRVAFGLYGTTVMVVLAASLLTLGTKKINRLKENISNTQSGTMFLYARKRQGV